MFCWALWRMGEGVEVVVPAFPGEGVEDPAFPEEEVEGEACTHVPAMEGRERARERERGL